ncbi:hypothetical protein O3P69_001848 [Scylla paramamosain]|uniref:Uncharacterized protein n=1 Tax=Scylla paramamosain TaxID=85552 RepID=A0AAW0V024_SCYPA
MPQPAAPLPLQGVAVIKYSFACLPASSTPLCPCGWYSLIPYDGGLVHHFGRQLSTFAMTTPLCCSCSHALKAPLKAWAIFELVPFTTLATNYTPCFPVGAQPGMVEHWGVTTEAKTGVSAGGFSAL